MPTRRSTTPPSTTTWLAIAVLATARSSTAQSTNAAITGVGTLLSGSGSSAGRGLALGVLLASPHLAAARGNEVKKATPEHASGATARDVAAEMTQSKLSTETKRPAFEQEHVRRLQGASCETYSVSGSEHQSSMHGAYFAIGECEGKTLYECLDCSSSYTQYLYYYAPYGDWRISSNGCGSEYAWYQSSETTSDDPSSAQWWEWSGSEWVETSTISLVLSECQLTADGI